MASIPKNWLKYEGYYKKCFKNQNERMKQRDFVLGRVEKGIQGSCTVKHAKKNKEDFAKQ